MHKESNNSFTISSNEDFNYGFALGLVGRKEGKVLSMLKTAYTKQSTEFSRGLVEGYFSIQVKKNNNGTEQEQAATPEQEQE
jgi:hypothetical protein